MPKGYGNISVPEELLKEVEKLVNEKFLGYRWTCIPEITSATLNLGSSSEYLKN